MYPVDLGLSDDVEPDICKENQKPVHKSIQESLRTAEAPRLPQGPVPSKLHPDIVSDFHSCVAKSDTTKLKMEEEDDYSKNPCPLSLKEEKGKKNLEHGTLVMLESDAGEDFFSSAETDSEDAFFSAHETSPTAFQLRSVTTSDEDAPSGEDAFFFANETPLTAFQMTSEESDLEADPFISAAETEYLVTETSHEDVPSSDYDILCSHEDPPRFVERDLPHADPEWFSPYIGPAPVRLMWTSSFNTMHLPRVQVCHTGHPLRPVDPGGAVQGWRMQDLE
jgi:hypothetical protein